MLSVFQPGSIMNTSAVLKVVNDITEASDCKKFCDALFIDLSKDFDAVVYF